MDTIQRNLNLRKGKRKGMPKVINKVYSIDLLNLFARYALSSDCNITKMGLTNMKSLFDLIDLSMYENDKDRYERVVFIRGALEARIDFNLNEEELILSHINGGLLETDSPINIMNKPITKEEISWIDNNINMILKYHHLYKYSDDLITFGTKMKAGLINKDMITEIERIIASINEDLKGCEVDNIRRNKFSLRDDVFNEAVSNAYNTLNSTDNKLRSGIFGLNKLLKGGFEKSRVYLLLGVTGGGKSLTLLNLAYQIKRANRNIKPKNPNKTPAILYMTMENNITESINRLYSIATGRKGSITDHKYKDLVELLRGEGGLSLDPNTGNNIDLLIEYVPAKGVDTYYIDKLISRYEDNNYEIICVIQDHIKKLKSSDPDGGESLRIDLGEIINQMKVIAADRNIPIITNSHLNRDANRKLEESSLNNGLEKVRKITRDNVGESQLLLDNSDTCIGVAIEHNKETDIKYLGIKILKARDGVGLPNDTIFHPFVDKESIKLVEDADSVFPEFKTSILGDDNNNGKTSNGGTIRYTSKETIKIPAYMTNAVQIVDDEDNSSDNNKEDNNDEGGPIFTFSG